jgi:hypothetical protein
MNYNSDEEEIYSWNFQDILEEALINFKIKKCYELIYFGFDNYPKEEDSLVIIFLENLLEKYSSNSSYKLILNCLKDYYLELFKNIDNN